jgi:hypothetical protein
VSEQGEWVRVRNPSAELTESASAVDFRMIEVPIALLPPIQQIRNKRQRRRAIKKCHSQGCRFFYETAVYFQFKQNDAAWSDKIYL